MYDWVLVAAIAFVGSHLLLSHPLRRPLVARFGERGFSGVYSIVALATLGWVVWAFRNAPSSDLLWSVGNGLWGVATLNMLLASILLMGSLVRNPAMIGASDVAPTARGVFAITRHPMMWSFALWGLCHILVYPMIANIELAGAIIVLALVGSAMQDRKKELLRPDFWRAWEAQTSYWPFAAILAGRARLSGFGIHALAGGLVVWLVATWAHLPLAGIAAGIWMWV